MNRTFDRKALGGISLVVFLIVGNMGLGYWNAVRVSGTADQVSHTQEVIRAVNEVLVSVKDAERGERGYIITKNEQYKLPYDSASKAAFTAIDHVTALVADNPEQMARIPLMREVVEQRMRTLAIGIAALEERGFEDARGVIMTDFARAQMDSLAAITGAMERTESRLLAQRAATYEESRRYALATSLTGGIIALAMVALFALNLRTHFRERSAGERLLVEQKELFRTTLASIGDAVVATDTNGRVIFINGVASELTGWTFAAAQGAPLESVFRTIGEESRQPEDSPTIRALRDGAIVGLANHTVLIAKDGRETPIDDSAAPIRNADGSISGAVLVFRDITERRRAERALRESDRSKDEFLAILAHELRNPMAPLRNALELLEHAAGRDPSAVESLRQMMSRQLDQLVRLTDDLLDVSRITRNKLEMRKTSVDIAHVVSNAVETCTPMLRQARHSLVQTLPTAPLVVDGDRARLVQVVYNLIGNAAKYTDPGGRIELTVSRVEDRAIITVKDNGVGVASDMLVRIFDMFTQADRSIQRSQGGLGIGLTLVKRIVEMHGGTIVAKSEGRGKGSEFTISLPALAASTVAHGSEWEGDRRVSTPTSRGRVLITDDNRDAADSTALLLSGLGYEVRTCYDGEQAISEGEVFRPDVMLLDIGLPGISGYDIARAVRAAPWGATTVLIALTGWGQAEDRLRSSEAGFNRHLVKPIQLRDLTAAIEERGATAGAD